MGTRAWVRFPLYAAEYDVNIPTIVFGEPQGDIFILVAMDGDTLPCDVQTAIQHMFANPMHGNLRVPQGLSAWLVAKLQYDYADPEEFPVPTYIYATEPADGYGMVVDFKTRMVTYMGGEREYTFEQFAELEAGVVFTAD